MTAGHGPATILLHFIFDHCGHDQSDDYFVDVSAYTLSRETQKRTVSQCARLAELCTHYFRSRMSGKLNIDR